MSGHLGRRRRVSSCAPGPTKAVGAGYLAAVLSGDAELAENFRRAFTADELLDAILLPVGLMARYLGYLSHKTPTEIGDALVRANKLTKEHI